MGDELGLESEVGAVKLDLATDEGAEKTSLLGLARVDLHDLLLKSTTDELVAREPDVLRRRKALEGALFG
jgi:hypothetical protein